MSEGHWYQHPWAVIAGIFATAAGFRALYVCYRYCGKNKRLVVALMFVEAAMAVAMGFFAFVVFQTLSSLARGLWGIELPLSLAFVLASGSGWLGPRGLQILIVTALTRRLPPEDKAS